MCAINELRLRRLLSKVSLTFKVAFELAQASQSVMSMTFTSLHSPQTSTSFANSIRSIETAMALAENCLLAPVLIQPATAVEGHMPGPSASSVGPFTTTVEGLVTLPEYATASVP